MGVLGTIGRFTSKYKPMPLVYARSRSLNVPNCLSRGSDWKGDIGGGIGMGLQSTTYVES